MKTLFGFRGRRHAGLTAATTVLAAIPFHACGDASTRPRGEWSGTVDTLPSGRIVVRNPDRALGGEGEGWTLHERFRLGALEGEGADVFGSIRDMELGPDGSLYVLEDQASEIRAFGPDGEYLRTFGHEGEGPGELNRPAGMAFGPDGNLWVMNWGNARYTAFDPATGELVEERRRLAGFTAIPWPGMFDGEGRLTDMGLSASGEPALLRLDTAFVPADTLSMPEADERHRVAFRRGDLLVMTMLDPFAPQPAWAPRPAGGIVVGEGEAYRLHRVGFDGDTTMTIVLERDPVPVSGAERDSALEAMRERIRDIANARPERDPRVPDRKPAHGSLLVDSEDRIWVRGQPEPGEEPAWDVFDAGGRFLGRVPVPVATTYVTPAIRGGRLALATEPDGIPTVVVYDVVEPSPGFHP